MSQCAISQHRLNWATWYPSDNFDNRPIAHCNNIYLIVIHNISLPPEQFGGSHIKQFFTNNLDVSAHPYFKTIVNLKVSSHLLILRDGQIIQFVAFDKRAWHAGKSCFQHQTNCNDFSIGIELEGTDTIKYTKIQYQKLKQIIMALKITYPIKHIVGHSDIAPGRKTDPGDIFDWGQIQ